MAFFAVMLPTALDDPTKFTDALKASFKGMDTETIKREQANMSRMGQLIRDAVVAASIEKGKTPPVVPVTPISSSSATSSSTGERKYRTDIDVIRELEALINLKRSREETKNSDMFGKVVPKVPTQESRKLATTVVNDFLRGTPRPDLSIESAVDDTLENALSKIEFMNAPSSDGKKKDKSKNQQQGKKKGGRHSTPRKSSRHSTYKRNMKH
jgi:hypothetical protein